MQEGVCIECKSLKVFMIFALVKLGMKEANARHSVLSGVVAQILVSVNNCLSATGLAGISCLNTNCILPTMAT